MNEELLSPSFKGEPYTNDDEHRTKLGNVSWKNPPYDWGFLGVKVLQKVRKVFVWQHWTFDIWATFKSVMQFIGILMVADYIVPILPGSIIPYVQQRTRDSQNSHVWKKICPFQRLIMFQYPPNSQEIQQVQLILSFENKHHTCFAHKKWRFLPWEIPKKEEYQGRWGTFPNMEADPTGRNPRALPGRMGCQVS